MPQCSGNISTKTELRLFQADPEDVLASLRARPRVILASAEVLMDKDVQVHQIKSCHQHCHHFQPGIPGSADRGRPYGGRGQGGCGCGRVPGDLAQIQPNVLGGFFDWPYPPNFELVLPQHRMRPSL